MPALKPSKPLCVLLTAVSLTLIPSASAATQSISALPPDGSSSVTLRFERLHRSPVPFELVKGKLVFRAMVVGQPVWALLDTGMQVSLLSSHFAQQNKLTVAGSMRPLITPTGSLPMSRVNGVKVAVPGQVAFEASFASVDLGFASTYLGRTIDLVIGEPYTSSLALVIFGPARRLEISPSGSLRLPPDTLFAPMTPSGEVEVNINGATIRAKLDLGSAEDLVLTNEGWAKVGLSGAKVTEGTSAGLDGTPRASLHTSLSEMRVGPFQASNVSVSRQLLTAKDGDAVVGLGFLSRFNFAVDQKAGKLWLLPQAVTRPQP